MKIRSNLSFTSLACLCMVLVLAVSCQKENSRNGTDEAQQEMASKVSSESDGEAEIIFNGLFDDALGVNADVGLGGTGIFGRNAACPDITITHTSAGSFFPVRIVLDFGVNGCVHPRDSILRKGKIIIEYTGRLTVPGSKAITTFDNFYYNGIKVEGIHKIENISSNAIGNKSWRVDVIDAKLTRPNGNYSTWNSHKTILQIEGSGTPLPIDDQFKITGSAHGKVLRGNLLVLWSSEITEPLLKRFNCRWIVKGKVRTTRSTTSTTSPWVAVLDFGAGHCDNQATITINGVLHQITLP